jgi:hypothetical protein
LTVLRLSVLLLSCCVHPWLVGWLNHCDSILFLYKSHLKNYNIIERGDFICAVCRSIQTWILFVCLVFVTCRWCTVIVYSCGPLHFIWIWSA